MLWRPHLLVSHYTKVSINDQSYHIIFIASLISYICYVIFYHSMKSKVNRSECKFCNSETPFCNTIGSESTHAIHHVGKVLVHTIEQEWPAGIFSRTVLSDLCLLRRPFPRWRPCDVKNSEPISEWILTKQIICSTYIMEFRLLTCHSNHPFVRGYFKRINLLKTC